MKERASNDQRILARVRDLGRRQRLLVVRLSRAEEMADALAHDFGLLEAAMTSGDGTSGAGGGVRSGAAARDMGSSDALRATADAGVSSLVLRPRSDGSVKVSIDRGNTFILPPMLGDLLTILAADGGPAWDPFVGWKSLDEVAILLGKRAGRTIRKHAVIQNIYRLRRELFARGGVNPYLVQTNRRRGARFALRRSLPNDAHGPLGTLQRQRWHRPSVAANRE